MAHFQGQHDAKATAVLSDEQFAELKALLQPGYELSTLMLADYKAQRAAAMEPPASEASAVDQS